FGVASFGSFDNSELSAKLPTKLGNLCLVGYEQFVRPSTLPSVEEIKKLRPACWRVVVFAHWGDEDSPTANGWETAAAHDFVDAGADLVVGAHPHVVQPHEVYKGRAIFYSLGNFIFDQGFSYGTTHALALEADFSQNQTVFTLMPLVIG